MSDGSLSQEEIDALLTGGLGGSLDPEPVKKPAPVSTGGAMGTMGSGVMGAGALPIDLNVINSLYSQNVGTLDSILRSMLDDTSVLRAPVVSFSNRDDLLQMLGDEVVVLSANFNDQVLGQHLYILSIEMAQAMAGQMQGLAQADLNEIGLEALAEAINTIAGGTATFLSSATGYSIGVAPVQAEKKLKASIQGLQDSFVKVVYPYRFDGVGESEIIEIIDKNVAMTLFPLNGGMQQMQQPQMQPQMMGMGGMQQQMMGMPASVQPVQFTPLNMVPSHNESGNIGLLMDVFMEMTVELGRTKRLIKDILGMGEGTIIELDKLAGEPVDILVNHKLIAKGEVVVIDENFGVRVTEIISPMERVTDV